MVTDVFCPLFYLIKRAIIHKGFGSCGDFQACFFQSKQKPDGAFLLCQVRTRLIKDGKVWFFFFPKLHSK